ncbi:transcriptional regulator [Pseudomonas tolaasii]|jgi:DNA-binding transcriptional regulator YiaG|uniref:helix-turn-helix domain-containing protein n=1 Tax=Pseudomonas tolaasii TaxID=29442 RepID=UPI001C587F6E|nr:transcriptional regulator [Pseudomonas tolaasii]MBW1248996.1 transcriptional regulator [Pseudomonas tolaasii]
MKMYKYTGSGLDGIFLKNGYTIVQTSYGPGVRIDDVDGLHRAIARDIIRQRTPMTGHQFRFLRKEQDLIQEEAAAIFRVDVQTIANWEKRGAEEIPGPPDVAMRAFYSAFIHANFGPILFEPDAEAHEGAAFEKDGDTWKESVLMAA